MGFVALLVYGLLIWLDLPSPAGLRYEKPPAGQGLVPAHWWDEVQGLRGWAVHPRGWSWALIDPAPLWRWLPLLGLGLAGALLIYASVHYRISPRYSLLALVILGYPGQLSALWLKDPNPNQLLFERVLNRSFTGYFTSATRASAVYTFFGGYADAFANDDPATRLCGHCRTHPPGPILFYWLPIQAVQSLPSDAQRGLWNSLAGGLQISVPAPLSPMPPAQAIAGALGSHLVLLGAALIVIPLYGLARRLAQGQWTILLAALGLVVPGILLMSPEFDQLYATATAALFYLAIRGLTGGKNQAAWGAAAGLWFALWLYWSFGLWVLVGPLFLLALSVALGLMPGPVHRRWRYVAVWAAGLTVGVALPWALLWGLFQFDVPRVVQLAGEQHLKGLTVLRPYAPWLLFNLVDFLQFVGLPLVVVSLATAFTWRDTHYAQPGNPTDPRRSILMRFIMRTNIYTLIFWATLLLLDLSGTVRGEVGRLWIFLVPMVLMGVYDAVGRGLLGTRAVWLLLAAQFTVCVLIGGRWLTP